LHVAGNERHLCRIYNQRMQITTPPVDHELLHGAVAGVHRGVTGHHHLHVALANHLGATDKPVTNGARHRTRAEHGNDRDHDHDTGRGLGA
jgi:hypothetical protein